jgi:hypothetical protein
MSYPFRSTLLDPLVFTASGMMGEEEEGRRALIAEWREREGRIWSFAEGFAKGEHLHVGWGL